MRMTGGILRGYSTLSLNPPECPRSSVLYINSTFAGGTKNVPENSACRTQRSMISLPVSW